MELHKPKNLYELLTLNMEQRFADRVAFRWYDADQDVVVEKHFGEYAQDIRRAVNYYLSTIPDIQGKRVCVWSNNSYHYAVNCYGVMMAGGVIVPMNQRKSWDELPKEAKAYVEFLEKQLGHEIQFVSTGAEREKFVLKGEWL